MSISMTRPPLFGGQKPRVVIVGNGIGGVSAATQLEKSLKKRPDLADVTVLGRDDHYTFKPLLPDGLNAPTEGKGQDLIKSVLKSVPFRVPMADVFGKQSPIRFRQAEVTGFNLDAGQKAVKTDQGDVPFDYLIYSPGAVTQYFNVKGAREHGIPMESARNLEQIRASVDRKLSAAVESDLNSTEEGRNSFVIVGAGATGVELALELREYVDEKINADYPALAKRPPRITILEARDAILPGFSDAMRKDAIKQLDAAGIEVLYNTAVKTVEQDGRILIAGENRAHQAKAIHSYNPIWVTGVKASPLNDALPFDQAHKGKIKVNPFLEVEGRTDIYAIGDAAAIASGDVRDDGQPAYLPETGQVAMQSGSFAARDLVRKLKNDGQAPKARPIFSYRNKGQMLGLGPGKAAIEKGRLQVAGKIPGEGRKQVYRHKMA